MLGWADKQNAHRYFEYLAIVPDCHVRFTYCDTVIVRMQC